MLLLLFSGLWDAPPAPPPPPPPVEDASGAGGPAQAYDKELRAYADEWYRLREVKQTLEASPKPAAKKLVKRLRKYQAAKVSFDDFRGESESLIAELRAQTELEYSLREAAAEIEAFIQDEQEALDVLMLEAEYQRRVIAVLM
jgi:hypothetical protein